MKNFALFALAGTMLGSSFIASLVGCNRPETAPSAPQATAAPTAVPAEIPESGASNADPLGIAGMLPETAIKSKNGKIVSLDLRSLSGDELTQAISLATKIDGIEEVTLSGEAVTDAVIAPILEVSSIVRLRLPQTRITDSTLATLAKTSRLKLLDLTDVTTIGEPGIACVGKMTKLVELNLMNTPACEPV